MENNATSFFHLQSFFYLFFPDEQNVGVKLYLKGLKKKEEQQYCLFILNERDSY